MKARHAGLFGGALLCAGIGSAQAQEFDWSSSPYSSTNLSYSIVLDYSDSVPRDYDQHFGAGPFSTFVSSDYGVASGEGTATFFRTETRSTHTANSLANTLHSLAFRVTADATIDISWDMTAFGFGTQNFMNLFDLSDGSTIFDTGINTAGSGHLSLLAGGDYGIACTLVAGTPPGGQPGTNFALITIPAPGGVGLLALAGLVSVRRRR
ncbi:MAG: hypothetical protein H6811_09250 [Phycisphaeraceae bacterium]|nr:hypothetical protein [Phycisphaeraceae bacterium]